MSRRADRFIARLDATCKGWRDRPFILQVDCEEWGSNPGTVPGRADIEAFCDRLRVRAPKLRAIVYAPEWVYGNKLAGLDYPLWASRYVSGSGAASKLYPGDGSSKWGAYSGQTPAILQFTSSAVIAGQTTCDANAYRGTLAELTALVAPGWTEEIDDMPMTANEFVNLLQDDNVRRALAAGVWKTDGVITAPADAAPNADGSPNTKWTGDGYLGSIRGAAVSARTYANQALAAIAKLDGVDESAIVSGVLAGLTPEAIAEAIPTDIAQQVVDELARRVQGAPEATS